jgi:DNA-binding response OmpR family regulator
MPHTLLLADDSVTIQRVIELTFADEDVRVIAVGDGRQAIDRIGRETPDIVLADVGMPGCDGYEVAAFVKDRPALAHVPVLLLAGAFEPVDEARVRQVRADGVLAKPFEPHELIARVKALLGVAGPQPARQAEAAREAELGRDAADSAATDTAGDEVRPPAVVGGVSLDDYFDRLDAAFASLSVPSHIDEAATVPRATPDAPWRSHEVGGETAPSQSPLAPGAAAPVGVDVAPPGSQKSPSPADAFAAFLDAEQAGLDAGTQGVRAGSIVLAATYPPVDELVEQVARRVIAQLTDQVVRDTVADIVSTVAERLVREEIERLRASVT